MASKAEKELAKALAACEARNRKIRAERQGSKSKPGLVSKAKDFLFGSQKSGSTKSGQRRFVSAPSANSDGTFRQGTMVASYSKLRRVFGPAGRGDSYKTWFEWTIKDNETGQVFTIYDMAKDEDEPRSSVMEAQRYKWNIGGSSAAGVPALKRFIATQG